MSTDGIFVALIQNAALLLALAFVFDLSLPHHGIGRAGVRQILTGLVIAVIAVVVMMTPWVRQPGLVFDTRSIVLAITGLFFGTISTAIVACATIAYRIWLGGVGLWMGIAVIVGSGLIGLAWRHLRREPLKTMGWKELLAFGFVVHLYMLAMAAFLPGAMAFQTFLEIAPSVLIIYPVSTMSLGLLMTHRAARIATEAQVRQDAAFLRLSEAAAHVGHWVFDPATRRLHWSDEVWRIFGRINGSSAEDPVTVFRAALADRSDSVPDPLHWDRLAVGERRRVSINIGENSIRHVEILRGTDIKMPDSSVAVAMGVLQDVTGRVVAERELIDKHNRLQALLEESNSSRRALLSMMEDQRLAESKLRESEQRYRLLVSTSPFAIAVHQEGIIVYANPAAMRLLGAKSEGEIIGRPIADFVHAEQNDISVERYKRMLESEMALGPVRDRFVRLDGREVPVEVTSTPFFHEGRHAVQVIAVDISDRIRAEESLREFTERLRELASRLESAQEEERKRIARDIHDSLGQELTAIRMDLSFYLSQTSLSEILQLVPRTIEVTDRAIATMRRISRTLRPDVLDRLGLVEAIRWIATDFMSHTKIACTVRASEEDLQLAEEVLVALFRIVQESLTNVARHSGATSVEIALDHSDQGLVLSIRDNGRGIGPADERRSGSLGLLGMQERVRGLGGTFKIDRWPEGGTIVSVHLPAPTPTTGRTVS